LGYGFKRTSPVGLVAMDCREVFWLVLMGKETKLVVSDDGSFGQ
jgi:hypothetical protein